MRCYITEKHTYKRYPKEFKEETVALVREQGHTVTEAAEAVGVSTTPLPSGRLNYKISLTLRSYQTRNMKS